VVAGGSRAGDSKDTAQQSCKQRERGGQLGCMVLQAQHSTDSTSLQQQQASKAGHKGSGSAWIAYDLQHQQVSAHQQPFAGLLRHAHQH
jgi:hypothetical protein